jgi:hypothetical protein
VVPDRKSNKKLYGLENDFLKSEGERGVAEKACYSTNIFFQDSVLLANIL